MQPEKQKSQRSMCRYCGFTDLPQRCPMYGKRCRKCAKMNHVSVVCRSLRHKAVKLDKYTEEDGQTDTENMYFINSNAKFLDILAKLKISSYQTVQTFHVKKSQAVIAILYHFTHSKFYFLDQQKAIAMRQK